MMETSVLIQVPYELEKVYSPLEERNDIDYVVMPVDNFNVSDFLMGVCKSKEDRLDSNKINQSIRPECS